MVPIHKALLMIFLLLLLSLDAGSVFSVFTPTHNVTNSDYPSLHNDTFLNEYCIDISFINKAGFNSDSSVLFTASVLTDCLPPSFMSLDKPSEDFFWHQRLRHMPFEKMKFIAHLKSLLPSKQTFKCNICPMARQQRFSFSESFIHSIKPFQLIHLDILVLITPKPIMAISIF